MIKKIFPYITLILVIILALGMSAGLVNAQDGGDAGGGDGGDGGDAGGGDGGDDGDGGSGSEPSPGPSPAPQPTPTPDPGETEGGDGDGDQEPVIVNTAPVLSIPDQTVNEDAGILDNLVDLVSNVVDDFTSAANIVFGFVAQTNANILSCSLDSGRFIDCITQSNQFGSSDITVSATDEDGLTGFGTFRINVLSVNDAPTVNIIEPGSKVNEDEEFDFIATATDTEGDSLTYTIDFGDGTTESGVVVNGRIETTHIFDKEGAFTISVTVSDGSLSASDSVLVKTVDTAKDDIESIIYIGSIAFDNLFYGPGDEVTMFVRFENIGDEDINDARLTAIIQSLGVRSNAVKAEVKDGQESSKTLILELPESAQEGRYWVELVIDIDGDRRIKYRPIDII